jgi:phospholipid/cholesterol/gamma-HCH transport system substrate-binding protein
MEDTKNKYKVVVGFFILIGLVFLIAAILLIGNLKESFVNKIELYSVFEDVNGLQKGNNVWYMGVRIGTVSKISFKGKSKVLVGLKVETNAKSFIYKDAKVKVSSDGLIGNKIMVIYGGSPTKKGINNGDTLMVEKAYSTDEMIITLQENNKNILVITENLKNITENLNSGKGTMGKLFNDDLFYNQLSETVTQFNETILKAKLTLTSLSIFSNNMNKKKGLLNEIVTDTLVFENLKKTALKLQNLADSATLIVSKVKMASQNQHTALGVLLNDENAGLNLKNTLKNLESSSQKLDEDLKAAQSSIFLRSYFKKLDKSK